jgi:hypothetical protein
LLAMNIGALISHGFTDADLQQAQTPRTKTMYQITNTGGTSV